MHLKIARAFLCAATVVTAWVLLSLTGPAPALAHSGPGPERDLSSFGFDTREKARLDGDWWFHFGARLTPQEAVAAANADEFGLLHVPDDWQSSETVSETNPHAHGTGTYVLNVTLPYSNGTPLAITFPRVADAYEVFWVPANDLTKANRIGGSGAMTGPIEASLIHQTFALDQIGEGYLVVQVRKELQSYGGILRTPVIADAALLQSNAHLNHIIEGTIIGITLLVAALNLFLFVVYRKDTATLLLALVSFAFLLRSVILAGTLEMVFGPDVRPLRIRIEYADILLAAWAGYTLQQALVWRCLSDLGGPLVTGVIAMLGGAVVLTAPLPFVTEQLYAIQMYCVVIFGLILWTSARAIIKRIPDAWFYTLGWFVPLAAGANDIIVANTYQGVYLANHAFVLFICAYSLKVGRRVTSAVSRAEVLDLERSNLQQLHQNALDTASRDHLTGLLNRQAFDNELSLAWREKDYSDQGISLVIFDIDHFKIVNDTYGHPAGDDVLRAVADLVQAANLRRADRVCRYGGEEFVMILPDTTCDNAKVVAERMRNRIAALTTECTGNVSLRVTASFGIACADPNSDLEPRELLLRADEALYHAKSTGRNRSVTYVQMIEEGAETPSDDLKAAG
ncbi:MAG: GGDEF domain-containing protein [Shimia sp.]|uniref:GGDEF domain-containing protein n=1 Tax=Shimia sp. TaxID=1954381 RepID=UPI0025F8E377|nr:diguanylate cyclase [Shimia sp.]MCH2066828.1 GGDEF domain-containing protein [Shimia sp.]